MSDNKPGTLVSRLLKRIFDIIPAQTDDEGKDGFLATRVVISILERVPYPLAKAIAMYIDMADDGVALLFKDKKDNPKEQIKYLLQDEATLQWLRQLYLYIHAEAVQNVEKALREYDIPNIPDYIENPLDDKIIEVIHNNSDKSFDLLIEKLKNL